jgi:hypothetical protein
MLIIKWMPIINCDPSTRSQYDLIPQLSVQSKGVIQCPTRELPPMRKERSILKERFLFCRKKIFILFNLNVCVTMPKKGKKNTDISNSM